MSAQMTERKAEHFIAPPAYTVRDVLTLAFYHWRIILFAACLPLLLAGLFLVKSRTSFQAESRLLVLLGSEYYGEPDAVGGVPVLTIEAGQIVQSEIEILTSDRVKKETVKAIQPLELYPDLKDKALPDGRTLEDAALERFNKDLGIDNPAGSNAIRVTFRNDDRQIAADTVNVLVNKYLDRRRAVFADTGTNFLAEQKSLFEGQLKDIERQINVVRQNYGLIDLTGQTAGLIDRQNELLLAQRQADEDARSIQAEVTMISAQLGALPRDVALYSDTTNVQAVDSARAQLLTLQLEREQLRTRYKDDYPLVQDVSRRIATVENFIAREKPNFQTTRKGRNPAVDLLEADLARARTALAKAKARQSEITTQIAAMRDQMQELREAGQVLQNLERTRGIADENYRNYARRAEDARVSEDSARSRNANVRIIQSAEPPPEGDSRKVSIMLAGLVASIFLGIASGILRAILRQTFIMPSEMERSLGLPVRASLPFSRNPATMLGLLGGARGQGMSPRIEPARHASDAALGAVARAEISRLVGAIETAHLPGEMERPVRLVQFMAARAGEGNSTIVRAVASLLAARHHKPVLLLDLAGGGTNQYRFLQHYITLDEKTPLPPAIGADETQGGLAILPLDGSNLMVSCADGVRERVLDLSDMVRAELRARFSYVILDGTALENAYQGVHDAALADATMMVVAGESTRAPVAANLRDRLLEAGANVIGIAMTRRKFYIPGFIYRWL